MIRVPRVPLVLVLAALLVLSLVPVAGARTLSSPSVHPAGDGWLGAALRWAEDLAGLKRPIHHGHSGTQPVVNPKVEDDAIVGTCIDPMGRPRPCPGF